MEIQVINAGDPRHHYQMFNLATFCGAQKITRERLSDGENYVLEKDINGKITTLVIKARENKCNGVFLCIDDKS